MPSSNIQSVYISDITSESRMLEVAKQKAAEHPDKLANVCYHRHGDSHVKKCYTLDLNEVDDGEGA